MKPRKPVTAANRVSSQFDDLYNRMQTDIAAAGFEQSLALPADEMDRLADAAARSRP